MAGSDIPDNEREDLTLGEAAQMIGLPPATLERWARAGRIPSAVAEGGHRTFLRADLLRLWRRRDDGSEA